MSKAVQEMFRSISSRYDLANDLLSMGIHRKWRKTLRKQAQLKDSDLALDLCTGTGEVALEVSKSFPGRVCALDFVEEMLRLAKKKDSKIPFLLGDATQLPFKDNSFGLATVSFGIRNLDSPLNGLSEIYRILKPNSQVFVLEFGQPKSKIFGALYKFYSIWIIPLLGSLVTGNRSAYEYLPETSAKFPCRESFTEMMKQAGFRSCEFKEFSFGIAYLYEGRK